MSLGNEQSLAKAAETCDDCLHWLEHCEAEGGRGFAFSLTPDADVLSSEAVIRVHTPLIPDTIRYYELHGARVDVDAQVVVVPRSTCSVASGRLMVMMVCSALDAECRCRLHGGDQPEVCSGYTLESSRSGRWVVPPRCLFAHKTRASAESPA